MLLMVEVLRAELLLSCTVPPLICENTFNGIVCSGQRAVLLGNAVSLHLITLITFLGFMKSPLLKRSYSRTLGNS